MFGDTYLDSTKLAFVISASVNIDVQVSLVCWSGVVYINTMEGSSCVVCLIYSQALRNLYTDVQFDWGEMESGG